MIPWYRVDLWLCWWGASRVDTDSRWFRQMIVAAHRKRAAMRDRER